MQNQKFLYQFGKYLFNRENLDCSISVNSRSQIEDSAFGDGGVRVNGVKRDFKGDYILTCNFEGKANDDYDLFAFFVLNEPQQIFFTSISADIHGVETVKVFWNYASYQSTEQSSNSDENTDQANYQVKFRMFSPYFYECTKDVDLIIPEQRSNLEVNWNEFNWNDATVWNDEDNSQYIPLANYTTQEQVEMIGCCDSKYRLRYVDRYWNTKNKSPKPRNLLRSTESLNYCIVQPPRPPVKWDQLNWNNKYWEPPNCNPYPSVSGKNWNQFNYNDGTLWSTTNPSTAKVECKPKCKNAWSVTCDGLWNTPSMSWNNFYWRTAQNLGSTIETINEVISVVNKQLLIPNAEFYQTVHANLKGQNITAGFYAKGNGSVRLGFKEYDLNGNLVFNSYDNFALSNIGYKQVKVTKKIDNSTAKVVFYWMNITATPLTISIANLQLNKGVIMLEYQPISDRDYYDINLNNSLPILISNTAQTIATRDVNGSAIDQDMIQLRLPSLAQNEFISILNTTNNTGYKITWLASTQVTNKLIFNCQKAQIFDSYTGLEINPENGKVKIEIVGNSNLKLTPNHSPPNEYWETKTNTLTVTSNIATQKLLYLSQISKYH
jgi:hypothetical protein